MKLTNGKEIFTKKHKEINASIEWRVDERLLIVTTEVSESPEEMQKSVLAIMGENMLKAFSYAKANQIKAILINATDYKSDYGMDFGRHTEVDSTDFDLSAFKIGVIVNSPKKSFVAKAFYKDNGAVFYEREADKIESWIKENK